MSQPSRPDSIPGYEHPGEQIYTSRNTGVYKTFSDGKKSRNKDEVFGTTSIDKNSQYMKASLRGEDENQEEKCPTCKGEVVYTCFCCYNDKTCANGHVWYTTRDGKIKNGNPHKG
jgi:hypothetical protein